MKNAKEKLTASNLDAIFKLTHYYPQSGMYAGRYMDSGHGYGRKQHESVIKKYSNGRYDHNVDKLYDAYLAAKQAYHTNGDQGHKDKLMEAVGRLMVEVYDMLSSMKMDSDFMDERKEIQRQIKKLAEM